MTDAESKILERAYRWDETKRARAGATGREKARLDTAHWKAGNDLSEAIGKAKVKTALNEYSIAGQKSTALR